jgi:hypothetical protein
MRQMLIAKLMVVGAIAVTPAFIGATTNSALDARRAAVLPVDATLLEESLNAVGISAANLTVFDQCSRRTLRLVVQRPRATSPPTESEIVALETKLNTLLADRLAAFVESYPRDAVRTPQVSDYYRQYSAFEVGGWRVIYVNGFIIPKLAVETLATDKLDWRKVPNIICDGGESAFGVEYYPAMNMFANFSFNGTYSGPILLRR